MNPLEAGEYQDALDAVMGGVATSVQYEEAEAVIEKLRGYLNEISNKVSAFKSAVGNLETVFPGKVDAVREVFDGKGILPAPRVTLKPKEVTTVFEPREP